jgi:putative Holliday junction resolvase
MPRILALITDKTLQELLTDEMQIIASGLTTVASATAIAFLKDYFLKEK